MGHEKDMEEKRYRIIGTAGHIDHGKTWLVKALTGTDTDRLAEEKRRGITIENGFAFLKFPDGREAGIIDVPGHEKFIKNMLAGAGGMDIAMCCGNCAQPEKPRKIRIFPEMKVTAAQAEWVRKHLRFACP